MKRAQSKLIEDFLAHVQVGNITATDARLGHTVAAEVLTAMREALKGVLDGSDPDDALGIVRTRGQPVNRWTSPQLVIALQIDDLRQKGEKWEVIGQTIGDLSISRLKKLHKEYAAEIAQFRDLSGMLSTKKCE